MRHMRTGRTLGRRREHRQAMLANLAASLIKSGKVRTTDAKAKEVRPFVERLVTFARRGDLHARRIVLSRLRDADAVKKLFDEIGPKFNERNGGYTRILKLGFRPGDNSPVSQIEFVEKETERPAKTTKSRKQPKETKAKPKAAPKAEAKPVTPEPATEPVAESAAEATVESTVEPAAEAAVEPAEETTEAAPVEAPEAEQPEATETTAPETVEETAGEEQAAEQAAAEATEAEPETEKPAEESSGEGEETEK